MRHISNVRSLVLTTAGLGFFGSALATEWTVSPETSSVTFVGEQQGTKFTGRFREFTATIDFDPAAPESGSIVGTVQTASVNTRDHDRDAALTDPDWFDSNTHPEARFESQSITKTADGYEAAGELTLKGTTKPAKLAFTFNTSDGGSAEFAGSMNLNRFDFKVGEGWNDTSWVAERVAVEVKLDLAQ
jgi:polyisoprenoid-binding protein YceI